MNGFFLSNVNNEILIWFENQCIFIEFETLFDNQKEKWSKKIF